MNGRMKAKLRMEILYPCSLAGPCLRAIKKSASRARTCIGTVLLFLMILVRCNTGGSPAEAYESARRHAATIYFKNRPVGSALVLDSQGKVLTCLHVARLAERALFIKYDQTLIPAHVVTPEASLDLAILAPLEPGLLGPTLAGDAAARQGPIRRLPGGLMSGGWAHRSDLAAGSEVYLLGSPYGLENSFLAGRISHTDRSGLDPLFPRIPFIQVSGVVFPGTSGAGLFTAGGSFAGIVRSNHSFSTDSGNGFVIPAGYVNSFLEQNGL